MYTHAHLCLALSMILCTKGHAADGSVSKLRDGVHLNVQDIHMYNHFSMYAWAFLHTCAVCVCVCCARVLAHVGTCICICICICVYVYVCAKEHEHVCVMYMYMYSHICLYM
jgi:hypothetical protein